VAGGDQDEVEVRRRVRWAREMREVGERWPGEDGMRGRGRGRGRGTGDLAGPGRDERG
jgi:hypothetical protein